MLADDRFINNRGIRSEIPIFRVQLCYFSSHLTDLWLDELESRLPESRRIQPDFRIYKEYPILLLPPFHFKVSTADFPFPWLTQYLFPTTTPEPIDASRASPSRWLTNQIPPDSWFLYLSPSLSLPSSLSRRLPADWSRLGRPDNPIEFEFMDIRKPGESRRIKGTPRDERIFIARPRLVEIERRDAISLSAAPPSFAIALCESDRRWI